MGSISRIGRISPLRRPGLWAACILAATGVAGVAAATTARTSAGIVDNLTGLPAYPHLDRAVMDGLWRTESLGRWCSRFTGLTSDSLDAVADWYRQALRQASETDLARDPRFGANPPREGIKLAVGTDYIALYRIPNQATVIELHHCGGSR